MLGVRLAARAALVDPRLTTLLRIQHALGIVGVEALFGPLPSRRLLEGGRGD